MHLVRLKNSVTNKANVKEKKKRKKRIICHVRVLKLEKQKVLVLVLLSERHPGGNVFPPVSGNQCTDSMNITVGFFAVKLLAHTWKKSVVKVPGLAWGWIRHRRKW